jgi:mannose-6-phosphate isomerase-like protein (cupin superfamily)
MSDPINIDAKFAAFADHWSPKRIARLNDYDVRLAKLQGAFVWHSHADTDEMFLVWRGRMRIELRDGAIDLGPGEMYVVPRGVEHRPVADEECLVLLLEPSDVVNTGDASGAMTATVESI